MINHLQLHSNSVCCSAKGMFCRNSVRKSVAQTKVITLLLLWYDCVRSRIKIQITVRCNLEQNVYSNQKEELDKRLNHSESSIFIEYLYIVMINRQKKKDSNIQMENEEKFSE